LFTLPVDRPRVPVPTRWHGKPQIIAQPLALRGILRCGRLQLATARYGWPQRQSGGRSQRKAECGMLCCSLLPARSCRCSSPQATAQSTGAASLGEWFLTSHNPMRCVDRVGNVNGSVYRPIHRRSISTCNRSVTKFSQQ
jgi:hypothetical protein